MAIEAGQWKLVRALGKPKVLRQGEARRGIRALEGGASNVALPAALLRCCVCPRLLRRCQGTDRNLAPSHWLAALSSAETRRGVTLRSKPSVGSRECGCHSMYGASRGPVPLFRGEGNLTRQLPTRPYELTYRIEHYVRQSMNHVAQPTW
jgi:hypothetical protein